MILILCADRAARYSGVILADRRDLLRTKASARSHRLDECGGLIASPKMILEDFFKDEPYNPRSIPTQLPELAPSIG